MFGTEFLDWTVSERESELKKMEPGTSGQYQLCVSFSLPQQWAGVSPGQKVLLHGRHFTILVLPRKTKLSMASCLHIMIHIKFKIVLSL